MKVSSTANSYPAATPNHNTVSADAHLISTWLTKCEVSCHLLENEEVAYEEQMCIQRSTRGSGLYHLGGSAKRMSAKCNGFLCEVIEDCGLSRMR